MKLFGSIESKITKDKNGENVPHFEITDVVLVHCNIAYNDYQQDSRVFLHLFQINRLVVYLVTFTEEILYGKLHFLCSVTHQNSQPLEIEDKINLTLIIK